jgi:NAD(P)-dependent dehydrogenase (short-subunit alcohol dehydrogenase family)
MDIRLVPRGGFRVELILDRFRLDGRVAIVTGASSGLGVSFSEALAECGASVVLAARRRTHLSSVVETLEERGATALAIPADVSKPADCDAIVEAAVAKFGKVDILINNAGIGSAVPATRETEQEFRAVIDVNLNGCYWMAQACGRTMPPGSSIVNVSSVLAFMSLGLPQAAYSASKSGLLGLTRDLAQQWTRRKGIRVNALVPGFFVSEMTDQYDDGYLDGVAERTLMGRLGDTRELAAAMIFLASSASAYVTGQALVVDGGLTIT